MNADVNNRKSVEFATLCISVSQLTAVVNKIRDNERKRLKSPEIAIRTAAHIPL